MFVILNRKCREWTSPLSWKWNSERSFFSPIIFKFELKKTRGSWALYRDTKFVLRFDNCCAHSEQSWGDGDASREDETRSCRIHLKMELQMTRKRVQKKKCKIGCWVLVTYLRLQGCQLGVFITSNCLDGSSFLLLCYQTVFLLVIYCSLKCIRNWFCYFWFLEIRCERFVYQPRGFTEGLSLLDP